MTSDRPAAISAHGLGKRYLLRGRREVYPTLRATIADGISRLVTSGRAREDELWALRDATFSAAAGEVLGIIGRNGSGKSTLLKILSRITPPTTGFADVRGKVGSLLEIGTGFHPELTGRENVQLNGAILGMTKREIAARFGEIVAFAEVERFVDTAVKHYSSGMYLRLAFAVAAHLEPDILIVDEVLAVGDARFQTKCLDKMREVSGHGRTVLFVSHNMGAVHRLCTRCLWLDAGRIAADGAPETVIRSYLSDRERASPDVDLPADASKRVCLRRVRLLGSSGAAATEFRFDEPIRLVVEYDVNEAVSDASVWAGVSTEDQTHVFGTADTDVEAAASAGVRETGHYRTEVVIPERLLNVGTYYIVVGATQITGTTRFDRVELPPIRVSEIGAPARFRTGIVAPQLTWATTQTRLGSETRV